MKSVSVRFCAFDLDGTLVDTLEDICVHVNRTLVMLGHPARPSVEIATHIGHGARELIRGVLGISDDRVVTQAVSFFRDSYAREPVIHSRPFPGAVEALQLLTQNGVACAVVTNKPRDISMEILRQLALLDRFFTVEGAVEGIPMKPDPAMLARAAGVIGALPERTCYVGDSTIDLDTAAAFGCGFVGIIHGMDKGAGLRGRGHFPAPSLGETASRVLEHLARRA